MKKAAKWALGIVLLPVVLVLLLAVALYIPPVQDWAVGLASRKATEGTGLNVSVGRVGLSFPLDIDMQRVEATDSVGDTLLSVQRVVVDLDLCGLMGGSVGVDEVSLHEGSVNTKQLIEGLSVRGTLHRFAVAAPAGIDLKHNNVAVQSVEGDGCHVSVVLGESQTDTTTSEPLAWKVQVESVQLADIDAHVTMDSLAMRATVRRAMAEGIDIDLGAERYAVQGFALEGGAELDDPHVTVPLEVRMRGLDYRGTSIRLERLLATISRSKIDADAQMGMTAFSIPPTGRFDAHLGASIDRADVLMACALAQVDTAAWSSSLPAEPLTMALTAEGNMERVEIRRGEVLWPNVVRLDAEGWAANVTDSVRRSGSVDFALNTYDLSVVKAFLGLGRDIRLPQMSVDGNATLAGLLCEAQAALSVEGRPEAQVKARFDAATESYSADAQLTALRPRSFMPSLPVGPITASLSAEGSGLDFMNRDTKVSARAELKRCVVDSIDASGVCLAASYRDRRASLLADCNNPLLRANLGLNAHMVTADSCDAHLMLDLSRLDLHALKMTAKPFAVGGTMRFDGYTNLADTHVLTGGVRDIHLYAADSVFHPKDINSDLLMRRDSLAAHISAGDLMLGFTSGDGMDSLLTKVGWFADELKHQTDSFRLDQALLKTFLPRVNASVTMGRQNPAAAVMRIMGYDTNGLRFNLNADPQIGLNGGGYVNALTTGSITLDTIDWHIYQDNEGVKMDARVCNGPKNKQVCFDARANAYVLPSGAGVNLKYTDDKGRCGVDVGTVVDILPGGIRAHLTPLHPILANRRFDVNEGNYVFMAPDGRVSADMDLVADDGTRLRVYSSQPDSAARATTLQDLTVSLYRLNVRELCSVMPYMPPLGGLMYGDVHLVQTADNMSVALDSRVDELSYDLHPLGDVALNATYLPMGDSCHYVDALVSRNGDDIIAMTGRYTDDGGDGVIDAQADVTHLPLAMLGGMVTDAVTMTLEGDVDGTLSVSGSGAKPMLNGLLAMDGVKVKSQAYNLALRVEDDTISIDNNRLELGGINVFSTGAQPLVIDGVVDCRDMDNINMDLSLRAKGYELINAKRTDASLAYGKVLVDVAAKLRGTLQALTMNGRLSVLGGTDVTYILQDTPLTVEDRLADLVTFVDFSDTLKTETAEEPAEMALTMNMQLSVDQSAQVHCLLSPDRSSYVDIEGGGDLMLTYTPQGDMGLTGRYTVINGEMKYALPIIPLKTFKLQSGSYVAWTGNIYNPQLNLSATERVRASVAQDNGQSRTVAFDVGLAITQTLNNMGLAFTVDAPEDAAVQNELATMDAAARGRVAVTMLATGMYITDKGVAGAGGGFSTTNALNTFLQGELSSLAGKALQTVDVNLGVEENTNAAGGKTTDYSFSFAKRFWDNRISVSFGGKVSSGADAQNTGATIIDNVAIEYRLDESATRYVRLAYDKNYESLLEGTVTEMSAGIVLRRKTTRLGELFIFRKRKKEQ